MKMANDAKAPKSLSNKFSSDALSFLAGYGRFYLILGTFCLCILLYLINPWHVPVLKGVLPLWNWWARVPHILLFGFGTLVLFREGTKEWREDRQTAQHSKE